jgi:DNA-directed RNA polymerase subunit F
MNVLNESPITMAALRAELDRIKKRDKELNFRGNKTEEYLSHFTQLDERKAKELYAKLEGLKVPRLKDIHITKIVDLLPATPDEVKLVLQGYTVTVNQDNLKRIAKTVEGFASQ